VSGQSDTTGDADYVVVAYDAATGAKRWARRYDGLDSGHDSPRALGVSPDGTAVFVTGHSETSATSWDSVTLAYDAATGTHLWTGRYTGPGSYNESEALGVSPDGTEVFVTGASDESGTTDNQDYATVAYDATTGSEQWVARYNSNWDHNDSAAALGVSPDGSTVFVTGWSFDSHYQPDIVTVAYDAANGTGRWATRWANGDSYPQALGVSPDGATVFVTGYAFRTPSNFDYVTVAYDAASAALAWSRRYDGPSDGGDYANALGVSPDGAAVYVTGSVTSATNGGDYATIAYDAE
jgi:hypothetical protein